MKISKNNLIYIVLCIGLIAFVTMVMTKNVNVPGIIEIPFQELAILYNSF